jgi:hypothetical protein
MKKLCMAAGLTTFILAPTANAANWLMLQGTEAHKEGQAPRAHVWGFIQAQYQKDTSDPNPTSGGYIPPTLIGPNLESQSQFNVNRARIGVRGTGLPLDSKVNYFILAEFGNNAITAPGGYNAALTDASITFNHIPHARVRVGMFKYPGAEEGLQAIHVFDWINFTTVTNQLLLERFPNHTYTDNVPAQTLPTDTPLTEFGYDQSVGAFRDTGIQVFDMFKTNNWEHTYAVMYGNGNGINFGDDDDNKDLYLYWSSELVFGGKGGRREGLKMFIWNQDGKRWLDNTNDLTHNPQEFDRKRSGLGFKYLKKPFRVTAEYMMGEGMIFVGPDKPSMWVNDAAGAVAQGVGNGADGEANGYYLEGGWYIPNTKWEIDLRYDVYNRLTNDPKGTTGPLLGNSLEAQFSTVTLGTQYHFNKKTRLNAEVSFRDYKAVDWDSGVGPNANLDNVNERYAIQVTHVF